MTSNSSFVHIPTITSTCSVTPMYSLEYNVLNINRAGYSNCVPYGRVTVFKQIKRNVAIDLYALELQDISLQEQDFPPANKLFLSEITIGEISSKFGEPPKPLFTDNAMHRLNIILPLIIATDRRTVVPLPFIVDMGSPRSFHLIHYIITIGEHSHD